MDPQTFYIPKQTDESLLTALGAIRSEFNGLMTFFVRVCPHFGGTHVLIQDEHPEKSEAIAYVLSEHSQIVTHLQLVDTSPQRNTALIITRKPEQIMDEVTVHWNEWAALLPAQ